jgi:hypothetical protein
MGTKACAAHWVLVVELVLCCGALYGVGAVYHLNYAGSYAYTWSVCHLVAAAGYFVHVYMCLWCWCVRQWLLLTPVHKV